MRIAISRVTPAMKLKIVAEFYKRTPLNMGRKPSHVSLFGVCNETQISLIEPICLDPSVLMLASQVKYGLEGDMIGNIITSPAAV